MQSFNKFSSSSSEFKKHPALSSRLFRTQKLMGFFLFLSLQASFIQTAYSAEGFGCSDVSGQVIFRDTLYGAATGFVLGAAIALTQDDGEKQGDSLKYGAATGTLLGFGLGITEIALRDCHEPSRAENGWSKPQFLVNNNGINGIQMSYHFF